MRVPALRLAGLLNGPPVTILVDSGAEPDCASEQYLEKHNITYLAPEQSNVPIQMADGQVKCVAYWKKKISRLDSTRIVLNLQ